MAIWSNIDSLATNINYRRLNDDLPLGVILTCGGFDPLHVGHVRCLKESALIKKKYPSSVFIVIVNGDEFLKNKKDFVFMPERERMEIIDAIRGVDHVVKWYDGTQNCIGAIEKIRPNIFTKGGDRSSRDKIPEADICDQLGCEILYGVGGSDKPQSSSWLTEKRR